MKREQDIHEALDRRDPSGLDEAARQDFDAHRAVLADLEVTRAKAPEGFSKRVMARLPERVPSGWFERIRGWWPEGRWTLPALAGAAAALLIVASIQYLRPTTPVSATSLAATDVTVHFELVAPGAHKVELVGSFNDWQPGVLELKGPDTSGRWTADVKLPSGRHEYQFLVDDREWVVDQKSAVLRPDGFGHMNAVVEI